MGCEKCEKEWQSVCRLKVDQKDLQICQIGDIQGRRATKWKTKERKLAN